VPFSSLCSLPPSASTPSTSMTEPKRKRKRASAMARFGAPVNSDAHGQCACARGATCAQKDEAREGLGCLTHARRAGTRPASSPGGAGNGCLARCRTRPSACLRTRGAAQEALRGRGGRRPSPCWLALEQLSAAFTAESADCTRPPTAASRLPEHRTARSSRARARPAAAFDIVFLIFFFARTAQR
jgi:hypothetical protein